MLFISFGFVDVIVRSFLVERFGSDL